MSIRGACGVVVAAAAVLALGGVPGRERAVVAASGAGGQNLEQLEATVAAHPGILSARVELAHAYLDANSPGLALSLLADAPESQQHQPSVEHMAARVLIEEGRVKDALALEQHVLSVCQSDGSTARPSPASAPDGAGCDFWLVVSATRRAEILRELVARGVEDPQAQPEASLVAYHNATHEARLALVE